MPSRSILAIACLAVGFVGGWLMRPILSPPVSAAVSATGTLAAMPDQGEANEAVRRHPAGITPLDHAGVTLGSCSPEGGQARCAIELVWDERNPSRPQHRVVTFGLIAGRWEVVAW